MVSRSTVEEKILDVAKGKMVLEHLVVATLGGDDASNTKGNTAKAQSAMDEVLMFGARNLFNDEAEAEGTHLPPDVALHTYAFVNVFCRLPKGRCVCVCVWGGMT
jgi:hypothetical protein